jgi:hypothetical protein
MKKKRAITIRLGPLGLSLLAAGITAVGFAAVSLAADGSGGGTTTQGAGPLPPPGAGAVTIMRGPRLSAADQKKMEEFQQCMQDNGAPAPPKVDPSTGPPKPPSAADQERIQKAYEACKDKLPSDLQNAGPPHFGVCGPPPGAPPATGQSQGSGSESGPNQDQSNQSSGTTSSGSSS